MRLGMEWERTARSRWLHVAAQFQGRSLLCKSPEPLGDPQQLELNGCRYSWTPTKDFVPLGCSFYLLPQTLRPKFRVNFKVSPCLKKRFRWILLWTVNFLFVHLASLHKTLCWLGSVSTFTVLSKYGVSQWSAWSGQNIFFSFLRPKAEGKHEIILVCETNQHMAVCSQNYVKLWSFLISVKFQHHPFLL